MIFRFPFLVPLIGLLSGIISGFYLHESFFSSSHYSSLLLGVIFIVSAIVLFLFINRQSSTPSKSIMINPYHALWIWMLFSGIGFISQWAASPRELNNHEKDAVVRATGIVENSSTYATGDEYIIRILSFHDCNNNIIRPGNNFRIKLKTDGYTSQPDRILSFPAKLKPVTDNPRFRPSGYAKKIHREGIVYNCFASADKIHDIGYNPSIKGTALMIRESVASKIENSSLDRQTSAFIISILLGDRSLLSEETLQSFSDSGASHILALSGLHVAIILGILSPLLLPFRLFRKRNLSLWIAISILWIYAFITGLAPSTTRACVMATFIVTASSLQRKNGSFNALLASACIILIFNPCAVFNAGFQLSFFCVASILLFAEKLNPIEHHSHPYLYNIVALLVVSLSATAGTWCLASLYFSKIPMMFLPINLLILPFLPCFMWIAVIYVILLCLGIDISWLGDLLDISYLFISGIIETFSADGSGVIIFKATWSTVVLWLLGLGIIGFNLRTVRKTQFFYAGGALLLSSILIIPFFKTNDPDSIIFHNDFNNIGVTLYKGSSPSIVDFPRYSISQFSHSGAEIFVIDASVTDETISTILKNNSTTPRYLILGGGIFSPQIQALLSMHQFAKIFTHPSLPRKREEDLITELNGHGVNNIFSLRNEGYVEEFIRAASNDNDN